MLPNGKRREGLDCTVKMSNFSSVARKSAVIVTAALCIQLTFGSILIPTNSRVPHGLQRSGLLKLSANDLGTHFGLAAHRGRNSLRKEGQVNSAI